MNDCEHPADAVMWNPYNKAVQCHRCGGVQQQQPDGSWAAAEPIRTPLVWRLWRWLGVMR